MEYISAPYQGNPLNGDCRGDSGSQENDRINFLVRRDGRKAATVWVARTLDIYIQALLDSKSHASLPQYRSLFEKSIEIFESWLNAPNRHDGS